MTPLDIVLVDALLTLTLVLIGFRLWRWQRALRCSVVTCKRAASRKSDMANRMQLALCSRCLHEAGLL